MMPILVSYGWIVFDANGSYAAIYASTWSTEERPYRVGDWVRVAVKDAYAEVASVRE